MYSGRPTLRLPAVFLLSYPFDNYLAISFHLPTPCIPPPPPLFFYDPGNNMGGTSVDDEFISFLQTLFPSVNLNQQSVQFQSGIYEFLVHEWEKIKTEFGGKGDTAKEVVINLRDILADLPSVSLDDSVRLYNEKHPECHLQCKRSSIRITADHLKSFFDPAIASITDLVLGLLSKTEVSGTSIALLVGGFANCLFLQEIMKDMVGSLPHPCKVIVPPHPHLAVMRGAVRFGVKPGAIGSRRARFTYGVQASERFDEDIHPEDRKVWDAKLGAYFIHNLFTVFVHENESIPVDRVVTHTLYPMHGDQSVVEIQVLKTEMQNPIFVDDPGAMVERLGVVAVPIANTGGKYDKPCTVQMRFGLTEIEVVVTTTSGCKRIPIQFHAMQGAF